MIQVNRIYLIFNRLVTKKFLVDTSDSLFKKCIPTEITSPGIRISHIKNNYYYKGMLPCFFGGLL